MATAVGLQSLSSNRIPESELDPRSLAQAFASFTQAAMSLERSYSQLHHEVTRLRQELQETNRDLAASLEENQRMRQRLDRILQGLPCGVLVVEGRTVGMANPEARRLFGVSAGDTLPAWLRQLSHCAAPESELELRLREGAEAWITIRHAELSTEAGGPAIFILQEITSLKRLQQEHEFLRRRQALAELSAVLAHEIRNPLGSLELFAGLLAESELGEEEQKWLHHLRAGLRTLAATVNNVLQYHGWTRPGLAPVDLGQLLRSLDQFLQPLAQQAQVRVELNPGLDGVMVAADRHGLEQVILNLALNSFRSMAGGGRLRLSGSFFESGNEAKARVEVADTGLGIALEDQERIFEPGFSTRPGSPGLGLAVCRTIMEQHRGSIAVSSQPGAGATFTLELPVLGGRP